MFIDREQSCSFSSITNEKIESIGITEINFNIFEKESKYKFHIVDENFPIPTDGILGRDFFTKFLCKIDYETFTITLTLEDEDVTLPLKSKINRDYYIKIEKRTELIYAIQLDITEDLY